MAGRVSYHPDRARRGEVVAEIVARFGPPTLTLEPSPTRRRYSMIWAHDLEGRAVPGADVAVRCNLPGEHAWPLTADGTDFPVAAGCGLIFTIALEGGRQSSGRGLVSGYHFVAYHGYSLLLHHLLAELERLERARAVFEESEAFVP